MEVWLQTQSLIPGLSTPVTTPVDTCQHLYRNLYQRCLFLCICYLAFKCKHENWFKSLTHISHRKGCYAHDLLSYRHRHYMLNRHLGKIYYLGSLHLVSFFCSDYGVCKARTWNIYFIPHMYLNFFLFFLVILLRKYSLIIQKVQNSTQKLFVQFHYFKLFMYVYITYNEKKESKVLGHLLLITIIFWTVWEEGSLVFSLFE